MVPTDRPPPDEDPMMTSQEVAYELRLGRRTPERWARERRLPAVRVGRHWKFPRDKIMRIKRMREWDAQWDDDDTGTWG